MEQEAETAAQSISRSFCRVLNLIGVTFSDSSGKPINVPDTASRPVDVTYLTFRSNLSANTADCCAPKKALTLEFSLRLPQSLSSSTLPSTVFCFQLQPILQFKHRLKLSRISRLLLVIYQTIFSPVYTPINWINSLSTLVILSR